MIFARIGHGPCYYHWNEIFAGVGYQLSLDKDFFFKFLDFFFNILKSVVREGNIRDGKRPILKIFWTFRPDVMSSEP